MSVIQNTPFLLGFLAPFGRIWTKSSCSLLFHHDRDGYCRQQREQEGSKSADPANDREKRSQAIAREMSTLPD
jgi:hypothetical protein